MQITILNYKNWHIKMISLINKSSKILFYIIINRIIYSLIIRLYESHNLTL